MTRRPARHPARCPVGEAARLALLWTALTVVPAAVLAQGQGSAPPSSASPASASPASAVPAAADVQAAMQRRIDTLEARLAALQQLIETRLPALTAAGAAAPTAIGTPAATTAPMPAPTAAAAPAAAGGWSPPGGATPGTVPSASRDEVDDLKRRVARQEMKVGKLYADAYDGPGAGLQITGYLDPTYVINQNRNSAGFQFLNRDPYTYDNSSNGDLYLRLQKKFGDGPMAPNVDIQIQPTRGSGLFDTTSDGTVVGSIFQQALMNMPLSAQWTVMAGYTLSYSGYEYVESTMTNTVSHNLLYDFSAPANYVGAGAIYTQGDWILKGFLGNEEYYNIGSRVGASPNRTPTLMLRADYTANSALYLGGSLNVGRTTLYSPIDGCDSGYGYQCSSASAYGGKIQGELDLTYQAADVQYNAQVDYGLQKRAAWNGGDAAWWGFSVLAHRKWSTALVGRVGATVRLDYLNNQRNGGGGSGWYLSNESTPGTDTANGFGISPECQASDVDTAGESQNGVHCRGANRWALTTALLFYPTDQWTLKAELRHDRANLPVFGVHDGSFRRHNTIFSLQTVYAF